MTTANQMERTALKAGAGASARGAASPQVRARCSGKRNKDEEVQRQLVQAMPEIVSASIEKAKTGSLVHTKWLWGIADKAEVEEAAPQASLAQLLVDELAALEENESR